MKSKNSGTNSLEIAFNRLKKGTQHENGHAKEFKRVLAVFFQFLPSNRKLSSAAQNLICDAQITVGDCG